MDTNLLEIYSASDLHFENKENIQFGGKLFSQLKSDAFKILIVDGDVDPNDDDLLAHLIRLKRYFDVIFFIPGNHDIWINNTRENRSYANSLEKYDYLLEKCHANGIITVPCSLIIQTTTSVKAVAVIPIHSWSSDTTDIEPEITTDINIPSISQVYSDFSMLKLPEKLPYCGIMPSMPDSPSVYNDILERFNIVETYESLSEPVYIKDNIKYSDLSEYFDSLNFNIRNFKQISSSKMKRINNGQVKLTVESLKIESLFDYKKIRKEHDIVISFSHFLPLIPLTPEKRFLFYPYLSKVTASQLLGIRTIDLCPDICIFGHTHFGFNAVLKSLVHNSSNSKTEEHGIWNCRFIQIPFGYPKERSIRPRSIEVGNSFNDINDWRVCAINDNGFEVNQSQSYWSEYYKKNDRKPTNTEPADYVKYVLKKYL